jgi:aspartyl-tRNA(Asn)/glutamyl-tRNA(Gln) amidotransferase subunit A
MLAKKECSSIELVESLLSRIENTESKIHAYITVCHEEARNAAKEIDKARIRGEKLHALAGIPVSVKDNICTKNILTTCASKILHNFVPPYDAAVITKLINCGAIILGKTNMDEFAMGSSCENSAFSPTCNPHDLAYVPGGSSGGSAAAVAAGSAVVALGSDTGGSIRQPASYCGIVGLKPTYGAVSRFGLVAFASSLDQIGPMTRTVKDAKLLFSAINGYDHRDATSSNYDYKIEKSNKKSIKDLRIGIPKEYFGPGVSNDIKEAIYSAVQTLEEQGANLLQISLPSTPGALSAYYIISSAEASSNLARYDGVKYGHRAKVYADLVELYENSRSEGFGDEVKRRIMLGTFVLSSGFYDAYYKRAKLLQLKIAQEFKEAFES